MSTSGRRDTGILICDTWPPCSGWADCQPGVHTWYSRINPAPDISKTKSDINNTLIIRLHRFDLDPYFIPGRKNRDEPELNKRALKPSASGALAEELLDELTLNAYVKTSGKTGLHIYVPVKRNSTIRRCVRRGTIGRYLMQRHEKEITMEWAGRSGGAKSFSITGRTCAAKLCIGLFTRPTPKRLSRRR